MRLRLLVPPVLLGLAACSALSGPAGSGPITLSEKTQSNYAAYLEKAAKRPNPGYFAVTADGKTSGYVLCGGRSCIERQPEAVEKCQKWSKGKPCYLYARGRQIVWNEDAAPPEEES